MDRVNQHNNFIYFTISLVAILLVSALGHAIPGWSRIDFSKITTLATLGIAYITLSFGPRWRPFVGITFLLTLLISAIDVVTHSPEVALAYRVVGLVFFSGATINCGRQVLLSATTASGSLSRTNTIVGALSIYLLLGLVWATLYMITLYFFPDAFKGITPVPGTDDFPRVLYFSYVTLATLGYGDISPINPLSKTFAYLEAVAGTFYLAIVVASLISGIHPKKQS